VPIRIYSKLANEVTVEEERICAKLIASGAIYNVFVECCRVDKPPHHRVFIAKNKKEVVGWSIIKHDRKRSWQFMVYVKKAYRRQGIGSKLYNKARRYMQLTHKEITVYRTDNQNTKFFDVVRNERER
jgi:GNAT superfamily N-acetyltransferase